MSLQLITENVSSIQRSGTKSATTKDDLVKLIQSRVNPSEKDKEKNINPFPIWSYTVNGETVIGMMIRYGSIRMGFVPKENADQSEEDFRKEAAKKIPELANKLWKQRMRFSETNRHNAEMRKQYDEN